MSTIYTPDLPPVPEGMDVADILTLRENFREDAIQSIIKIILSQANSGGTGGVNVREFGAIGYGEFTSETDTRALEDALAYVEENQTSTMARSVVIPDGMDIKLKRPMLVPNRTTVQGSSREGTHIGWASGYTGHSFLWTDDYSTAAGGPQYTTVSPGVYALHGNYDGADLAKQWYLNVTQYQNVRLSNNWTIRFDFNSDALTNGDIIYGGAYVGSTSYTSELPHMFQLYADLGVLKFRFRHGNAYDIKTIATASNPTGAFAASTWYNLEFSWDKTNGKLRVYLNGELWTQGAYSPGAGDGSGFVHRAWERISIGCGAPGAFPSESIVFSYMPGLYKEFAITAKVNHTASSFTPSTSFATENDGNTLLYLDFSPSNRYHGLVKGIGVSGTSTVYLAPTCAKTEEHAGVRIQNMRLTGGLGLKGAFASNCMLYNVYHFGAGEGWTLSQNSYFSNIAFCDVVASQGQVGINMGSWSYGAMIGTTSSGAIPFAGLANNVTMLGCSATVQGACLTGWLVGAGSSQLIGCSVDAENATTGGFVAPAIFTDWVGSIAIGCTFYPSGAAAPGLDTGSAVLIYNGSTGARYKFESCFLWPSAGEPVFKIVELQPLGARVICSNVHNPNDEALCVDPEKVIDGDYKRQRGSFTLSGGSTGSGIISLPFDEPDTDYQILINSRGVTGTPAADSKNYSQILKQVDSFELTFDTAPGIGNSRTFDWVLVR